MGDRVPRVALVAGASRGLGLAVARRLVQDGVRVHAVQRGASAELRGIAARVYREDLCEPHAAEGVVASVLECEGRLDAAVFSPGDFARAPLAETSIELLRELWRSNVEAAQLFAGACRGALRVSAGSLVFFGCAGVGELRGRRGIAGYAAVKSALVVLARSMAIEEGAHGVRVNVVAPGLIPHADAEPRSLEPLARDSVPLGRLGTPEEVARVVVWLLSEQAGYVTGQVLDVAGGYPR